MTVDRTRRLPAMHNWVSLPQRVSLATGGLIPAPMSASPFRVKRTVLFGSYPIKAFFCALGKWRDREKSILCDLVKQCHEGNLSARIQDTSRKHIRASRALSRAVARVASATGAPTILAAVGR